MAEEQQDYESPARDAQAAAESSGSLTKGQNKLGFMMTMDSGDWRGKGTEYNLQKQQGEGAQQISDAVPRRAMTLPPSDAYQYAHDKSYVEKHEAGVPFEHAGYMWIRDLHGNIVPISESSAFVAKYNNDKNQEQMKSVKPSGDNHMMTPQQELGRIDKSEKDKSEGPAYGFQGMTAGQINEERGVREGRKGELDRQINGSALDRLRQHFFPDKQSMSDESPDPIGAGQKFAANTVSGGGNVTYVQKPDGRWWQHDNFGPVGPMPIGWTPPPVRAPGR